MKHTIKRKPQGQSFRLIDFHHFNKRGSIDSDSESNEEEPNWEKKDMFVIQMFGINTIGDSVSLIVHGFNPFFYIKVSNIIYNIRPSRMSKVTIL